MLEQLQLVCNGLSSDERFVLTSTLQGEPERSIGKKIGKSTRTVRRLLAETRRKIELQCLASEKPAIERNKLLSETLAPLKYSDYVLEELLGTGGMGKVFRAREKDTGRIVAIKALHKSRHTDERAVAQFLQEAQILAKLHHPNIVGVNGLGRFPSGSCFMVMDYVDGIDMQSRIKRGPVSLSEVIRIVEQVALGIQHAHNLGVVHCDVKPGNVLLDKDDRVFVTDFGFAFLIAGGESNELKSIGGTEGYIAPEILSRHSPPTPAADVYGIGMLMWTLATGTSPSAIQLRKYC